MTQAPGRPRRRPTDFDREVTRIAGALAATLGRGVRERRRRLGLSQRELGLRVGLHQTRISQIELGRGRHLGLEAWAAIGLALRMPLAMTFSRPLDEERTPADAGHLRIQEALLRLARETGRSGSFELPTRPADPRRSVDVCVVDHAARVVILEEAWNTFGDLGAAIRSTDRKRAEAAQLAATLDDGPPFRVAVVWVVAESAANRDLVRRYPEILARSFPGASRAWLNSLTTAALPPAEPGLVWFDRTTGRIHPWRKAIPARK